MKTCIDCGNEFKPRCHQKRCDSCLDKIRWWKRYGNPPRNCLGCGQEFQPTNNRHRYCCPACRPKPSHRRPDFTRECRTCGTEFKPISNQRYCDECGPRSTKGRQVNRYRRFKGDQCERCGFQALHPAQLDIHHIDGDNSNDAPENLETICANCHRYETWGS